MQSSRLPPFAAAAPTAPVARLKSATDYGAFARELESRIAGSRDRQRASPPDGSDPKEDLSVELTDGRDGRPDRLASDRAEPLEDIKPTPVDAPPEPLADAPDIAPSDDVPAGAPDAPRASGDPFGSSPGVATSFNPTLSTLLAAALPPDNAGSADVSPAPPAKNDSARTASVSVTPVTQRVPASEASPLFSAPPTEAALSDATDTGAQSATTQAVAADVVSTVSGRTPIRREERRLAVEPARADVPTGSVSVRSDPLVSPLEPLRASVVEESRTDGAVDGTSVSRVEPTTTPNPATQLARMLVDLAGGNTGTFEPVAPTEVGTTSEAPAPSSNIVAVADTSIAAPPTLTPTPVAQGNRATLDVAAATQTLTTDANEPLQDVVKFVAGSVGLRNAHVRIQLDPPELGAMRIDIRTRQQILTVRIEVETADALARIQGGVAQLKQSLEQHGLVVERFDVQLRPTDSASPRSDGGDVRDDRFADPHSSFERDRPENESSRGAGPSSAGPGGDEDDRIEDTATGASDGETRHSTLTAASVDLWA